MRTREQDKRTPQAAQENIRMVARMEEELQGERSTGERVADIIAGFAGNIWFAVLHLLFFAVWVLVNSGFVPLIVPFDPYPFILLALMVSCESVLLATFVLMKQNRMSVAADRRGHLNLQIDLLAEKEITKMLQMQRLMCKQMGIEEVLADNETRELSQETAIDLLAGEVKENLERT